MATAGAARGAGPERAFHAPLPASGQVVLDAEESAHLVRARRARVGDAVVLFDGVGGSRAGRLVRAEGRGAVVAIEGEAPDRTPTRRVRLAVALPEMGRADRMVAMLAELGVAILAPLVTARSEPGRTEQAQRRAARWAKLAREACKVNGSARALVVDAALDFGRALAEGAVILDPDPQAPSLAEVVGAADPPPWLLLGPEGGFTPAELEEARTAGAPIAQLGAPALRVETAAVATAAVTLAGRPGTGP